MNAPKLWLVALTMVAAGCAGGPMAGGGDEDGGSETFTPDVAPDGGAPTSPADGGVAMTIGGFARVTASQLNLRAGPGTTNQILTTMPCGARVSVDAGPSDNGWWNVTWERDQGWASGKYLVAEAAFDGTICAGTAPLDGGTPQNVDQMSIIGRAKLAVGYSYWWGHGAWRDDGQQRGACFGSCPNCTHNGSYGADCSGFVGKCWQIPGPSPITVDLHPYSTWNFYNQTTYWSVVPRSTLQAADALVHNANGRGHIALYESTDPWGAYWLYEARGCSYGIVHNLRTLGSEFKGIRREGL